MHYMSPKRLPVHKDFGSLTHFEKGPFHKSDSRHKAWLWPLSLFTMIRVQIPQIGNYEAEIDFLTSGVHRLPYTTPKLGMSIAWLEYKTAQLWDGVPALFFWQIYFRVSTKSSTHVNLSTLGLLCFIPYSQRWTQKGSPCLLLSVGKPL